MWLYRTQKASEALAVSQCQGVGVEGVVGSFYGYVEEVTVFGHPFCTVVVCRVEAVKVVKGIGISVTLSRGVSQHGFCGEIFQSCGSVVYVVAFVGEVEAFQPCGVGLYGIYKEGIGSESYFFHRLQVAEQRVYTAVNAIAVYPYWTERVAVEPTCGAVGLCRVVVGASHLACQLRYLLYVERIAAVSEV